MVIRAGKVLLGRRRNAHGEGEFAFPGGHLEFGESWADCAIRETLEETGLVLTGVQPHRVMNLIAYGRHYVHVTVVAECAAGEPELREPEKCEGWDWYPLDALPQPLFATIADDVAALTNGERLRDS